RAGRVSDTPTTSFLRKSLARPALPFLRARNSERFFQSRKAGDEVRPPPRWRRWPEQSEGRRRCPLTLEGRVSRGSFVEAGRPHLLSQRCALTAPPSRRSLAHRTLVGLDNLPISFYLYHTR